MSDRRKQLNLLIDTIAWAKTQLLLTIANPKDRSKNIKELEEAVKTAKATVKGYRMVPPHNVPFELEVELRTTELGLEKLTMLEQPCDKCGVKMKKHLLGKCPASEKQEG